MSIRTLKSSCDIATVALSFLTFLAGIGILIPGQTQVLLFLTFLAGAVALVTGNVINGRQGQKLLQFDENLTHANRELAGQQERAVLAERSLFELKQKMADRVLTDIQLVDLSQKLKAFLRQEFQITPYWDSQESTGIADQIKRCLLSAGWKEVPVEARTFLLPGTVGIVVSLHSDAIGASHKAAGALVEVLKAAGLEAKMDFWNEADDPKYDRIDLRVGSKS